MLIGLEFFPTVRVEWLFLVGLIFAYLQVQDSMDMKQIFMSIKYQATTSEIKYSKFYIFKYDFWNTLLYKFHIYIHLNSNETM